MKRIAFVINYIVNNGPSNVILNIIDNLSRKEFEITVITLFNKNDPDIINSLRAKGIKVRECKTINLPASMFGIAGEFYKTINESSFDIIHTHGVIPDILSAKLKNGIKKISTIHCNFYEDYINLYGITAGWFLVTLQVKALKKMDRVICCSQSVCDALKKIDPGNFGCIRNGIEKPCTHSVLTRKEIGVPDDARVYVFTGRLVKGKRIKETVQQFVACHTEKEYLLILGSGPEEEICRKTADPHVRFCGFQNDPIQFMNQSDIYISGSKSEGFSLAVLEALFCGLKLFLSDIPSHREIVAMNKENDLGLLFSEGNFSTQIEKIREMPFDKNKVMAFAESQLSASRMATEYRDEYLKMIHGN
ncbi:MAG: glycosyltransferase [Lentisphaeria bacterium]|nr:glycosyltransferase [Lentisphaeria bacterium]MBR3506005.1 glycosyltransferase [Lentisphaeria bacterium]